MACTRASVCFEACSFSEKAQSFACSLFGVLVGCTAFPSAEWQYQSYHLLLSEVSSFTARLAHIAYRPLLRPAGKKWWEWKMHVLADRQHWN